MRVTTRMRLFFNRMLTQRDKSVPATMQRQRNRKPRETSSLRPASGICSSFAKSAASLSLKFPNVLPLLSRNEFESSRLFYRTRKNQTNNYRDFIFSPLSPREICYPSQFRNPVAVRSLAEKERPSASKRVDRSPSPTCSKSARTPKPAPARHWEPSASLRPSPISSAGPRPTSRTESNRGVLEHCRYWKRSRPRASAAPAIP
jgi:hypothetical protein